MTKIALHDLTGFEGRCDAVLFTRDTRSVPPNQTAALAKFRAAQPRLPAQPDDGRHFDLVVVGGGMAGTAAAVSAARKGLNICNLLMAGRDINVTREALGAVRMMRTTGMMGEIVGKAAWICVRHDTTPRGVDQKHLPLLKKLMEQPGAMRREPLDAMLAPPPC